MTDVHSIDPVPIPPVCPRCGRSCALATCETPSYYFCPVGHGRVSLEGEGTSEAERLALELAEVPRTLVAGAFERLGAMLPERGRPIARDAAKAVDETIVEFMTKERRTVPR